MGGEGDWRGDLARLVRLLSSTVVIGAVAGAVIGGLGGRLAMRILFLTTGDEVKGVTSDDGFEIGRFTFANSLGLVVVCTVLGVIAAMLYLLTQPFVARLGRGAVPAMAVFYGIVGGALMVNPDGVDFTALDPAALAIVLFVGICAGFGAAVSALVNRAEAHARDSSRSWWLVGPPLVVLLFPPLLLLTLVTSLVQTGDRTTRVWRAVSGGAYAIMTGVFALSAVNLASDAAALT